MLGIRKLLTLPEAITKDVAERALLRGVPEAEMYRRFLEMGMVWERIDADPKSRLIIQEEGRSDREIVFSAPGR